MKSLTWTQKLSDQLNLAHVAAPEKNMKKKKLKQTNASAQIPYKISPKRVTFHWNYCKI